jgi:elongation factor P--(R)-beta-lysine ligase
MAEKPSRSGDVTRARHEVLRAIRLFFYERDYLEVETPYLSRTAPADPHIEPLSAFVGKDGPYFLHTSPEVGMKKLLSTDVEKIFQICKVFREEEFEEEHSIEFTMVEWYRPGSYVDTMEETRDLVRSVAEQLGDDATVRISPEWDTYKVRDLFIAHAGFDPLPLSREDLTSEMTGRRFGGLDGEYSWADLFFKLWVQEVEPRIGRNQGRPFFVTDWPASLTAMAKKKDAHTVERFELYLSGLEIANGYSELLDGGEQRQRIEEDNTTRGRLGKRTFTPDEAFLDALDHIRWPVSGVSVGVDRLLMALLGRKQIADILVDRFTL